MVGTTVKAIVDVTPTTMVIRPMAYVIVDSTVTRWCRRVLPATSLATAEVMVDEAMFSTLGGRRQLQERDAKRWQGPATATATETETETEMETETETATATATATAFA
jgi:hypothetical protein